MATTWYDDVAAEAKKRRGAPAPTPVTADASPVAKAVSQLKSETPWATTHDDRSDEDDDKNRTANVQGEQVPLRLAAKAAEVAAALRKGSPIPKDEYGQRAPMAPAAKDGDTDGDDVAMAAKAEWTTAYVNDLPDSAFLYVAPGGSKDDDGKTTPRDLRHFPVKGSDGKPDGAHVRDALGRIPQSDVPAKVKASCTAAAQRMLDDINGDTKKSAWPSDLAAAAKGATSAFDKAVAKVTGLRKATTVDAGQTARDHAVEPEPTERGKVQNGAVPVREVDKSTTDHRVAKAGGYGFNELQDALTAALRLRYPPKTPMDCGVWPRDVFDDCVVFCQDGKMLKLHYVYDGVTATLGATPIPVRIEYVPAAGAPA